MVFEKYDFIKTDGKIYRCEVCDEDVAMFCEVTRFEKEEKGIDIESNFLVSNSKPLLCGFKFEFVGE